MTIHDRIEELRKQQPTDASGVWEIWHKGRKIASFLGVFEDFRRFSEVLPKNDAYLPTLDIRLVEPGAKVLPPPPKDQKVVRIEYEYEDGEIRRAVGADAQEINRAINGGLMMAWLHGDRYNGPQMQIVRRARSETEAHATGGESPQPTEEVAGESTQGVGPDANLAHVE